MCRPALLSFDNEDEEGEEEDEEEASRVEV